MEYKIQYNIGKVKYLVSYFDEVKKHKDDFTTSDLQGAIQAQVHNAITYKERGGK